MIFSNRFFYNANEEGAGGGSATDTVAEKGNEGQQGNEGASQAQPEVKDQPQSVFTKEELKEFGITDELQLKDKFKELWTKNQELNKPDAEKEKAKAIERAEFLKYSAENDLIKPEDLKKYETYQSKADRDLVFENYLNDWKNENPEVSESEIQERAKQDFEDEYKLNSTNSKTKERALRKLSSEAGQLRSPYENSYNKAFQDFREAQSIKNKVPEFNKFIDEVIKDAVPEKLTIKTKEGEEEIPIEVVLTKEQKEEINKVFRTPKVFAKYSSAEKEKIAEVKESIKKKIEGYIKINNFEAIATKGYEVGKGIGTNQGSTVGAENSFALKQNQQKQQTKVVSLEDSNSKIAEARERYRSGR